MSCDVIDLWDHARALRDRRAARQRGNGEVCVAEDTKLKRRVAVRVLPSNMSEDPDALARFRREAVAIAALNHANIVTIHSVEESDGVHFLTMELIDGKPLAVAHAPLQEKQNDRGE